MAAFEYEAMKRDPRRLERFKRANPMTAGGPICDLVVSIINMMTNKLWLWGRLPWCRAGVPGRAPKLEAVAPGHLVRLPPGAGALPEGRGRLSDRSPIRGRRAIPRT